MKTFDERFTTRTRFVHARGRLTSRRRPAPGLCHYRARIKTGIVGPGETRPVLRADRQNEAVTVACDEEG